MSLALYIKNDLDSFKYILIQSAQAMEINMIILKLAITFFLALLFGLERQRAHKPIGFGTFIFVAIGSCGLAMVALDMNKENPLPLLGSIVTGIGFLGAGALIKTTDKIFGFTTAAGIWVFAIFGLLIGVGEYVTGIAVYFAIWLVIILDNYLESSGIGPYQRKLVIETNRIVSDKEIKKTLLLNTRSHKLISLDINKSENKITAVYLISSKKNNLNQLPGILFKSEWVNSCKIE
ncbi:MAG: MgtC/SapB family protein [Nanoarchaeota archaeon]